MCSVSGPSTRPARPASAPGNHCTTEASIACDVEAVKAKRDGKRIAVTLKRGDEFAGRCAGKAAVKSNGSTAKGKFDFGDVPPLEGGPSKTVVEVKRGGLDGGDEAKATARPYLAFGEQRTITIR